MPKKISLLSRSLQRLGAQRRNRQLRRTHRSFRLTRRREHGRELVLPGYIAYTAEIVGIVRRHARQVLWLVGVFTILSILLGGIVSQHTYAELSDTFKQVSDQVAGGQIDQLGQASLLAISLLVNPTESLSDVQRLLLGLLSIWLWLVMVWLLRQWLMENRPSLRDAVYSSGGPFAASVLLAMVLVLQLVPLGIATLLYQGLAAADIAASGFGAMISGIALGLIATLSLYWATSTLIALVVVTLPGMYPMRALRAADDIVNGRRLRIMLRLLWGMACVALMWILILVPIMLLDAWAKSLWEWFRAWPLVPYVAMVLIASSGVWFSCYIYMLYRRIVDHDARA